MARLDGKVAIVTGAGRPGNIGLAVCEAYLREGATVLATDLRDEFRPEIEQKLKEGLPEETSSSAAADKTKKPNGG